MELNYIAYEDLIFLDLPGYDRINTYLELKDNSWMYYILKCDFHTKTQGDLCVQFMYNGLCVMKVEQNINNETYHYEYEFSYDLFKSYIRVFLIEHFESWDSEYAFNGGNIVLGFYNSVIGSMKKRKHYH